MTYNINSYEIFLKGDLNPIAHTAFDESAINAERRFTYQINNYIDSHIVMIKIDLDKVENNPQFVEELLESMDFIKLGFLENDKITIEIDEEDVDENNKIEIRLKSESKGETPSLESEKLTFYNTLMKEIKDGIKKDLKETTLNFDTEEKLRVYINQQYQFGINFLKEFYQRRKFIAEVSKSMQKISKVKKPNETNMNIITFIISDLWGVLKFIENNYKIYLSSNIMDVREFENNLYSKKINTKNIKEKSGWKRWLDIELLELKPNIAGLGININEIINRIKKRND